MRESGKLIRHGHTRGDDWEGGREGLGRALEENRSAPLGDAQLERKREIEESLYSRHMC